MIQDKCVKHHLSTISILNQREQQHEQKPEAITMTSASANTNTSSQNKTKDCKNNTTDEDAIINPSFKIQMRIHKDPDQHHVYVNGEYVRNSMIELHHDDVISLYKNQYRYKVHCITPNPQSKQPKQEQEQQMESESESSIEVLEVQKLKPPPPPLLNKIQLQAQNNMLHGLKCPICFEILVQATCVNPCGHVFCYKCVSSIHPTNQATNFPPPPLNPYGGGHRKSILKLPNCPTCRKGISSMTRMRIYDDLIWNAVCLNNVMFANNSHNDPCAGGAPISNDIRSEFLGDLDCYFKRCGKSKRKLTKDEKNAIFGTPGTRSTATVSVPVLPLSSMRQQRKRLRFQMESNNRGGGGGGMERQQQLHGIGIESASAQRPQPGAVLPAFNVTRNLSTSSSTSLGRISLGDPNDVIDWSTTFNVPRIIPQQERPQRQPTNGASVDDPIVL